MKKQVIFGLTALFGMCLLTGCSNDFDVTTNWKEIPVVYGLLHSKYRPSINFDSDTAQYIRIERAYLDENGNAFSSAQVPDSIYFRNLSVQLKQIGGTQVLNLERVNGNDLGITRPPGTFANSPNYLYRLMTKGADSLRVNKDYQLVMQNNDNGKIYTAQTAIINNFNIISPTVGSTPVWKQGRNITFSWKNPGGAAIYDMGIRFVYDEHPNANPTSFETKSVDWNIQRNLYKTDASTMELKIDGGRLFEFLKAAIPTNPNVFRCNPKFYIYIYAGGEAYRNYVDAGLSNSGITGSNLLAEFTNIAGGRGLFSSIYKKESIAYIFNQETQDSIASGLSTRQLNFQPANDADCQ